MNPHNSIIFVYKRNWVEHVLKMLNEVLISIKFRRMLVSLLDAWQRSLIREYEEEAVKSRLDQTCVSNNRKRLTEQKNNSTVTWNRKVFL